jgi:hypothetical protein
VLLYLEVQLAVLTLVLGWNCREIPDESAEGQLNPTDLTIRRRLKTSILQKFFDRLKFRDWN